MVLRSNKAESSAPKDAPGESHSSIMSSLPFPQSPAARSSTVAPQNLEGKDHRSHRSIRHSDYMGRLGLQRAPMSLEKRKHHVPKMLKRWPEEIRV